VDVILKHYQLATYTNTDTRQIFYRLWMLLTSWMFVNNYLYILNREVRLDLIPIISTIINLTHRFRAPHEDRWVTLMIWENIRWLYNQQGAIYIEEATRLTTAGHRI
jgi:hypothetical protein